MKFDTDSVKTKYLLKLLYWQSLGSSAIKPQFTGKIFEMPFIKLRDNKFRDTLIL